MTTKPKFQERTHYEDHIEFFVNGESVGNCNHDEHGWSGMEAMRDLFARIAEELGCEVEEIEQDDE